MLSPLGSAILLMPEMKDETEKHSAEQIEITGIEHGTASPDRRQWPSAHLMFLCVLFFALQHVGHVLSLLR